MVITDVDRRVAERLKLPPAAYSLNVGLMMAMLNALIERGWSPTLSYEPGPRRWQCLLSRHDGRTGVRGEHDLPHGAVVHALLHAFDELEHAKPAT